MIEIKNLSKSFGSFQALDKLSFGIETGESVALLGPNGSGKTTLIKAILGLVTRTKGDILFQGKKCSTDLLKQYIGYMPQIGRYPENMKVKDLFALMLSIRKASLNTCDLDLYHAFEMDKMAHKSLGALSGGMKQKVGAVLAFLFQPNMVILDEPTAGLDPISSTVLKDKIRAFQGGKKTVMITSHIISELDDLVDKVIYLIDGHLHFYRKVIDIKAESHQLGLEKALAHILQGEKVKKPLYASL